MPTRVLDGSIVQVMYLGTMDDGTVFDRSEKPLQIEVGAHRVVPGFERALLGMKAGETKKVHLTVDEAYGQPDPKLVKSFPRNEVPTEAKLGEGMVLGVSLPNGMQIPARVTKLTDEEVTIDINHPLAGKALNFKITVKTISVKKAKSP